MVSPQATKHAAGVSCPLPSCTSCLATTRLRPPAFGVAGAGRNNMYVLPQPEEGRCHTPIQRAAYRGVSTDHRKKHENTEVLKVGPMCSRSSYACSTVQGLVLPPDDSNLTECPTRHREHFVHCLFKTIVHFSHPGEIATPSDSEIATTHTCWPGCEVCTEPSEREGSQK